MTDRIRIKAFYTRSKLSTTKPREWLVYPSYVPYKKYIFVNIVYHTNGIVFIAVSIKNIVDMSNNKQFVISHACRSYTYSNRSTPTYR